MHINEVSKRLYPHIGRNPNFGPIFSGKKWGLSAGKYGIPLALVASESVAHSAFGLMGY